MPWLGRLFPGYDRQMLSLCLAGSLFVWFILKMNETYVSRFPTGIDYLVPAGRVLLSELPDQIDLSISANGWQLLAHALRADPKPLTVDLSALPADGRLTPERITNQLRARLASDQLTITRVSFEQRYVELAEQVKKRVPVRLRYHLFMPHSYTLRDSLQPRPDSVDLFGSQEQLDGIDSWPTDSITIELPAEGLETYLPLREPKTRGLSLAQDSVHLRFQLEAFVDRSFIVPVRVLRPADMDSVRLFPDHISLTAGVLQSRYDSISLSDFEVTADLSQAVIEEDARHSVPLVLTARPQGVVYVQLERYSAGFNIMD